MQISIIPYSKTVPETSLKKFCIIILTCVSLEWENNGHLFESCSLKFYTDLFLGFSRTRPSTRSNIKTLTQTFLQYSTLATVRSTTTMGTEPWTKMKSRKNRNPFEVTSQGQYKDESLRNSLMALLRPLNSLGSNKKKTNYLGFPIKSKMWRLAKTKNNDDKLFPVIITIYFLKQPNCYKILVINYKTW